MSEKRRYAADPLPQNRYRAGKAVQPHSLDEANMARPRGAERQNHRQGRQAMMPHHHRRTDASRLKKQVHGA